MCSGVRTFKGYSRKDFKETPAFYWLSVNCFIRYVQVITTKTYDFAVEWADECCSDVFTEHDRDSLKVNVLCALATDRVIGPIFFSECTVTPSNYLDILRLFSLLQINDDNEMVLLHIIPSLLDFLDETFPQYWIWMGRCELRPPLSPDLTSMDFCFWGFVKQKVCTESIRSIQH